MQHNAAREQCKTQTPSHDKPDDAGIYMQGINRWICRCHKRIRWREYAQVVSGSERHLPGQSLVWYVVRNAIEDVISAQVAKLQKYDIMNGAITIAIDKHLIPRYDKRPGPELFRSKSKKGTWKFKAYITAQCVDAGCHLTPAVLSIRMGDPTAEFVRKIIQIYRMQNIKIRCFLMDREFFSASVLNNMNSDNHRYVVPCKNTYNMVDTLNEFDCGVRDGTSHATLESQDVSVRYVIVIEKRTSRKDQNPDDMTKERYIGFAVNSNEIDVVVYPKRWGNRDRIQNDRGCKTKD